MSSATPTRERLLHVAGEIFAEHGYRGTTVRAIVRRAGANLAAVTYHFGGKAGLYAAVLRSGLDAAVARFPVDGGAPRGAPVERRLAAFIRAFCHRVLDPGRPAWHGKLMAREMAEPGPAFDRFVRDGVGPIVLRLRALVRECLGPRVEEAEVRLAARSIIAQCVYYRHAAPILARLGGGLPRTPDDVARLAAHITRFSLGGLRAATPRRAAAGSGA